MSCMYRMCVLDVCMSVCMCATCVACVVDGACVPRVRYVCVCMCCMDVLYVCTDAGETEGEGTEGRRDEWTEGRSDGGTDTHKDLPACLPACLPAGRGSLLFDSAIRVRLLGSKKWLEAAGKA